MQVIFEAKEAKIALEHIVVTFLISSEIKFYFLRVKPV